MFFLMRLSMPISLLIGDNSYRKEFAPLGSKLFPLKVTLKFEGVSLFTDKNRQE